MTSVLQVVRIVCASIMAGAATDSLVTDGFVALAVAVLTGTLFITILEAGAWR